MARDEIEGLLDRVKPVLGGKDIVDVSKLEQ